MVSAFGKRGAMKNECKADAWHLIPVTKIRGGATYVAGRTGMDRIAMWYVSTLSTEVPWVVLHLVPDLGIGHIVP